jgi:hypothetical protein
VGLATVQAIDDSELLTGDLDEPIQFRLLRAEGPSILTSKPQTGVNSGRPARVLRPIGSKISLAPNSLRTMLMAPQIDPSSATPVDVLVANSLGSAMLLAVTGGALDSFLI